MFIDSEGVNFSAFSTFLCNKKNRRTSNRKTLTLLSDMANDVIMRGIDGLHRFKNKLSTHKHSERTQHGQKHVGIRVHDMRGRQLLVL